MSNTNKIKLKIENKIYEFNHIHFSIIFQRIIASKLFDEVDKLGKEIEQYTKHFLKDFTTIEYLEIEESLRDYIDMLVLKYSNECKEIYNKIDSFVLTGENLGLAKLKEEIFTKELIKNYLCKKIGARKMFFEN